MYDLIVIGGGPGGSVAAEMAGARGKSVLLIEKDHLGGVCLNRGCIPAKLLLHAAKLFSYGEEAKSFGVHFENAQIDLKAVMARKTKVIDILRKGMDFQMKRHKVNVVKGAAHFIEPHVVEVNETKHEGSNVIIATGSSPLMLPVPGMDSPNIMTSTEILEITELPQSLAIIGGGAIGMEFASFFSHLGTEVHVIEMMPEIIPNTDAGIAKMLRRSMKNVQFHLDSRVESVEGGTVRFYQNGGQKTIKTDKILLSIGRKPNCEGLGLDKIGVEYYSSGIKVNDRMETSVDGIYAVGDVTGKSLLAHSASRMGEVAVDVLCGGDARMNYKAIPSVVYTTTEVAVCGMTKEEAEKEGRSVIVESAQMCANGRFRIENGSKPGICKITIDARTEEILGIHMFGDKCSELIFGAALMIEHGLRVEDVKRVVFPHPTISEIIRDTM